MNISKIGSAGGIATALILRNKVLEEYYLYPNFCLCCGAIISVKDNEKVRVAKRKKFCSKSCSAKLNNTKRERKEPKPKNSTKSKNESNKIDISKLTKDELFKRYKNYQSSRSTICKNARKVYFNSDKEKKCFECGYDKKIDVAHIKSVSSFSLESRIEEINHIDNLIALCPNHHGEFDDGTLELKF